MIKTLQSKGRERPGMVECNSGERNANGKSLGDFYCTESLKIIGVIDYFKG
jgi:hypothetical protein